MKNIVVKVIVGGDGGVGKTTFLQKYCTGAFISDTKLTVGVDFMTKKVELGDTTFTFAIWDFGGQDQFRFILKSYVRGAHGGLLFFALDRVQTFMNLEEWVALLRTEKPELPLVLVGTKADLEDQDNLVQADEIDAFIAKHRIIAYIRTSSKTGENITSPIDRLATHFNEHGRGA